MTNYTHILEHWTEHPAFINDVEVCVGMFVRGGWAEEAAAKAEDLRSELGDECTETAESILEGWKNELREAMVPVSRVIIKGGIEAWENKFAEIYTDDGNGIAVFAGYSAELVIGR